MPLPTDFVGNFHIATSNEIRSWSFGALNSPRPPATTFRDNVPGTLFDQAIFGPIHDFRCACNKYAGERHKNMICDRCGVKIARTTIRQTRFGHIEFAVSAAHPFEPAASLECFPVLPIPHIETNRGEDLAILYDQLIDEAQSPSVTHIQYLMSAIIDHLLPVAVAAAEWAFAVTNTLARGMALENNNAHDDPLDSCRQCGYPLAGLRPPLCPYCGKTSR